MEFLNVVGGRLSSKALNPVVFKFLFKLRHPLGNRKTSEPLSATLKVLLVAFIDKQLGECGKFVEAHLFLFRYCGEGL